MLGGRIFDGNFDIPNIRAGKTRFRRLAEIAHGSFVAREGHLAGFEHDLAAVTSNLETVGSGSFAGAGDKNASCAVWIFHEDRDVILYFDVVVAAELAKS